jgi:hypothetical protein
LNYLLYCLRIKIPKKEVSIYHSKFSKMGEALTHRVEVSQVRRPRLTEYTENYYLTTHCQLRIIKFKVLTADLEMWIRLITIQKSLETILCSLKAGLNLAISEELFKWDLSNMT